jgi:hypothetical protein
MSNAKIDDKITLVLIKGCKYYKEKMSARLFMIKEHQVEQVENLFTKEKLLTSHNALLFSPIFT